MGDHGARLLSPLFARRLVRRDRRTGAYQLNLADDDRLVLHELLPQFTALLDEPDHPVVRRLFPPAYTDPEHADEQEEYRRLMLDDLIARHREEFELVAATADAKTLSEEQLLAWTRALNSIRLILGTYLDVTEDDERRAPQTPEESLYHWLSYLLGEAIEALDGQT